MSGEQWTCEVRLPRGGQGVLPQKCFEKVSALRLILVGFGISDCTCTCKQPVKSGTGDHYLSTAVVLLHV